MKNLLKKTVQKMIAIVTMLVVSFAALAAGSKSATTTPSFSSRSGMEISGLVAFMITLIILLTSKTPPPRKFRNKNSVY
jgi:hypothetical protein